MNNIEKIIVTLGGYYADQKGGQALILRTCPPGGSPKGGQRYRLIGGDSYGC